jgi:hypothetical protein
MAEERVGEILKREHGLSQAQLEEGLRSQEREGRRLGSMLMALGHVSPDAVANALARQKGVPAARRKHFDNVDPRTLELVPKHVDETHRAIPLGIAKRARKELIVAMRDPDDQAALDEIQFFSGMPVRAAVAPELVIEQYLGNLYGIVAGAEAPVRAAAVAPLGSFETEPEPAIDLDDVSPEPVLAAPIDLAAEAAPIDLAAEAAPIDLAAEAKPIDLAAEAKPVASEAPSDGPARSAPPAPAASALPPARVARPEGAWDRLVELVRPWLALAGLVAGSAAFIFVARTVQRADVGGRSPVAVEGLYYCRHLGASISFPYGAGWTYLPKENQTQSASGYRARGAFFYSGGTAEEPDEALILSVLDSRGQISDEVDEGDFERLLEGFRGGVRSQGPVLMRMDDCEVTGIRGPLSGECTGGATYEGVERDLIAYVWIETGGIVVVVAYVSVEPVSENLYTVEEIVESIELE